MAGKTSKIFIHQTADVSPKAQIGEGTKIWNWVQVREGAKVGKECIIGKGSSLDSGVTLGDRVKVQNNASLYTTLNVEDDAYIGPHACFTNDKYPRAVNPDMTLKGGAGSGAGWHIETTNVKKGASVGAGAVVGPGVTIGEWAMVGMGSVVTKDVPAHALVYGNPARVKGFVCRCAKALKKKGEDKATVVMECPEGHGEVKIPKKDYELLEKR